MSTQDHIPTSAPFNIGLAAELAEVMMLALALGCGGDRGPSSLEIVNLCAIAPADKRTKRRTPLDGRSEIGMSSLLLH